MSSKSSLKQTVRQGKKAREKNRSTKPLPLQATVSLKTPSGYASLIKYSELISMPGLEIQCFIPVTPSRELSRVVELLEKTSSVLVLTDRISRNIAIWEKSFKGYLSLDQVIFLLLVTKLARKSGLSTVSSLTYLEALKELKSLKIPSSLAFPDMPASPPKSSDFLLKR